MSTLRLSPIWWHDPECSGAKGWAWQLRSCGGLKADRKPKLRIGHCEDSKENFALAAPIATRP
ncbi:hypothetical protein OAF98_02725 [Planctomicrobium sp.]|nr:hypothetical protein [Planctomicrobium sp.]MBT5019840.1 hypothetical protein [Planctomicrobium sp.]MDB4439374.1 hypothetical protein [Planctomicrobium sp.]MDB4743375.1 hypothetical protein [Planctomicrobium sp.]